jgi:hypothetical protein
MCTYFFNPPPSSRKKNNGAICFFHSLQVRWSVSPEENEDGEEADEKSGGMAVSTDPVPEVHYVDNSHRENA